MVDKGDKSKLVGKAFKYGAKNGVIVEGYRVPDALEVTDVYRVIFTDGSTDIFLYNISDPNSAGVKGVYTGKQELSAKLTT